MRRIVILSLLLASCSPEEAAPAESREWTLPSEGVRRIKILAAGGAVEVRTDEQATLRVRAEGGRAKEMDVATRDGELEIRPPPGSGPLSVSVAAPAGLDLQVLAGSASVAVAGSFGALDVGTRDGAVRMEAACAGGSIRTVAGRIDASSRSVPERDLEIRSDAGDLDVRVPAAFQGGIQVGGAKGKIEIVPHKRQSSMVWDPDETNVKGWVGPVPTQADMASPDWKDRPSILARTKTGSVRFQLTE